MSERLSVLTPVQCPSCGSPELRVLKTHRDTTETNLRLKRCSACGHRFASVETVLPISAIHYPGGRLPARREGYQRIDIF